MWIVWCHPLGFKGEILIRSLRIRSSVTFHTYQVCMPEMLSMLSPAPNVKNYMSVKPLALSAIELVNRNPPLSIHTFPNLATKYPFNL